MFIAKYNLNFIEDLKLMLRQRRLAFQIYKANLMQRRRNFSISFAAPFVSVLLHVTILGTILSIVFDNNVKDYIVYFAFSFAIWQSISSGISHSANANERANRFIDFPHVSSLLIFGVDFIENSVALVLKLFAASTIVILVNISIFLNLSWYGLFFGIVTLAMFLLSWSIVLAYLFDSLRILRALLSQFLYAIFLLTPILWHVERLGEYKWIANFNPFFHLIETIRKPILLGQIPWISLFIVWTLVSVGMLFSIIFYKYNKTRLTFRWVN